MACSFALSFLVGGLSALRYFPTVARAMPKVREMAHRESPCILVLSQSRIVPYYIVCPRMLRLGVKLCCGGQSWCRKGTESD